MAFNPLPTCETTISLLRALTGFSKEACVSIELWSVATVIFPFIAGVVVLQYTAKRLLDRKRKSKPKPLDASANVYGSGPVRSTGAWRD